ncbi:hypothetical protein P152DRAFT_458134 [Eremomyces bilateralis CBS 781.70]|uniref:Uncharacterized protein n=1 Tax=Eremomyces bilateralis CBS 781.70 TaxID=1392243 RepID=A0A6G1G4K5_9PEZI|nr:uncharacterized protein P152DRAFT_458134 [Eremomyces bilateralis CBS 781.70]KAF1812958.1 hypothetical protein P152DRAFT_458134 [Eremomyces bilateralis CBS 781.70]
MTEGRQSPPPSNQRGDQQSDPQANPNETGAAPTGMGVKEASAAHLKKIPSNPTHPLEKEAEAKLAKTMPLKK